MFYDTRASIDARRPYERVLRMREQLLGPDDPDVATTLFNEAFCCQLSGEYSAAFPPRALGVLLAISGLGWMLYLSPSLARHLFIPYIAGASALGEIPLLLWCLVVGVNDQRWQEQASAAGVSVRT